MILIWDGLPAHRSRAMRAYLARQRRWLTVERLPGYAPALHLLGEIATHPDRFDAENGEAHYREALALAEPRGMRPLVAHCHLGLGKLFRRTGDRQRAQQHLATAPTMYREMGDAVLAGAGGGGEGDANARTRKDGR